MWIASDEPREDALGEALSTSVFKHSAPPERVDQRAIRFRGRPWLICYATALARADGTFSFDRASGTLDQISGLVLVGLGTRLALEKS